MSPGRSDSPAKPPRFQLLRGHGEGERLDRFLTAANPLELAAPEPDRPDPRSGARAWGFVLVLGVASLVPALLRSSSLAEDPGEDRELAREGGRPGHG